MARAFGTDLFIFNRRSCHRETGPCGTAGQAVDRARGPHEKIRINVKRGSDLAERAKRRCRVAAFHLAQIAHRHTGGRRQLLQCHRHPMTLHPHAVA